MPGNSWRAGPTFIAYVRPVPPTIEKSAVPLAPATLPVNEDDIIEYTITVGNPAVIPANVRPQAAAAVADLFTNFLVEDVLPDGLEIYGGFTPVVSPASALVGAVDTENDTIRAVLNLPSATGTTPNTIPGTVTITFRARVTGDAPIGRIVNTVYLHGPPDDGGNRDPVDDDEAFVPVAERFWYVGNRETEDIPFVFYKTEDDGETRINGAQFQLWRREVCEDAPIGCSDPECDGDYIWVSVKTLTSGNCGEVGRMALNLTPDGYYRLRETVPPPGFVAPPGNWYIHWDDTLGDFVIVSGQNPNFAPVPLICGDCPATDLEDCVEDFYVLHLPNDPETVQFRFHKTDERLYSRVPLGQDPPWEVINHPDPSINFLLAEARFAVYRWNDRTTGPADGQLVDHNDPAFAAQWTRIWQGETASTPADYRVVSLDSRYTYFHLVEAQPPPGFDMPRGQWRLSLRDAPDPNAPASAYSDIGDGFFLRVYAVGDSTIPAFLRNNDDDPDRNAHPFLDGLYGVWYVGNRPTLELPLMGGTGRTVFLVGGLLTLLLAMGLLTYTMKRNRLSLAKDTSGGTCASCVHGTRLHAERVFCLRRGIMPLDGVCSKYACPAERSGGETPSPP